jgi:hypothetical protein
MSYRKESEWNEVNEIRCLIIFKKLEEQKFIRGRQMFYCQEMARNSNLSPGNISAKVCNYKSVAGVNKGSNASLNTKEIYRKYINTSISDLEKVVIIIKNQTEVFAAQ